MQRVGAGSGADVPPLRLREALLLAILAATAVLVAEAAALVVRQPHYLGEVGRGATAVLLWGRYVALYGTFAAAAWLIGLPLRRLAAPRPRLAQLALLGCAFMLPVVLGGAALRPSLRAQVPSELSALALAGAGVALLWLVLRMPPPRAWRLLGALAAGLPAAAAVQTWALQHLPSQLLTPRGALGLVLVAAMSLGCALPLVRALRSLARGGASFATAIVTAALLLASATALLVGAQLGTPPAKTGPAEAAVRGSVLWVVADTLRADHASDRKLAPQLARFADGATRFSRAHAAAPWTLPSFASMLTSLYAEEHRAGQRLPGSSLKLPLRDDVATLQGVLAEQGFATAAVLSNSTLSPRYGLGRDFGDYRDLLRPQSYHPVASFLSRRRGPAWLTASEPTYLSASVQKQRILEAIDRAAASSRPFFVLGQFMDPHKPYAAPAAFHDGDPAEADARAHYAAEVRYLDRTLGELLEALRERGHYDELTVVFSADHGEEIWEQRLGSARIMHGHTLFQELVHVPLVIKLPRGRLAGVVREDAVSLVDVAPTLLGALGIPSPAGFRGRDLFAPSAADSERVLFAGGVRLGPERMAAIQGTRKLVATAAPASPQGSPGPADSADLAAFDLAEDPGETRPLGLAEAAPWADALGAALRGAPRAQGPAATSDGVDLDPVLRKQLGALGYAE